MVACRLEFNMYRFRYKSRCFPELLSILEKAGATVSGHAQGCF
jgi:hypothetical protein